MIRVCRDCDNEDKEKKTEKKEEEEAKEEGKDEVQESPKATTDRAVDAKVKDANIKGKQAEEKKIAFKNFLTRPRAEEYDVLMTMIPGRLAEASLQMLKDMDTNMGMNMYIKK